MSDNPFLAMDREIIADAFTSDYTKTALYTLCDDIGIRFAGTEGEKRGAEYIAQQFSALDSVRIEEFPFTAWRRGPAAETVYANNGEIIPCLSLPYGAPSAKEGVTAEVVDIGAGAPKEIERLRKQIQGRLVMTEATAIHRGEIYGRVIEAGARAFILKGSVPGMLLPTGCVSFGKAGDIPAVGIPLESGLKIRRRLLEGPVTLTVKTFDSFEEGVSRNVVGEIRGSEYPDEYVLTGGHMDSHDVAPGAMDNASGTVCVMEAARLLLPHKGKLKRTIRFITFGGEEVGLLGSHNYAKVHEKDMPATRFMLNMDCVSHFRPKGLNFHKVSGAEAYTAELRQQMREPLPYSESIHAHSDHFPFLLKGVPSGDIGGGPFNGGVRAFCHMAGDTPDKVSLIDLREQAALAARFLLRASNDPRWPLKNRSSQEVDTLLRETGLAETMAYEKQKK